MTVALDPNAVLEALSAALAMGQRQVGYKHDASGTPAATGYVHGPGGLLSYPGIDQDVFHTVLSPLPGLLNQLPTRGSSYLTPLYEVLTGIQADPSSSEITAPCDDPLAGGLMKAGIITAPYGRYERRTREMELNSIGFMNDRAEPMDLRLVGQIAFGSPGTLGDPRDAGNPLLNEMAKALRERAVSFHRLISRQLWQGNPANNNDSAYMEMAGLDLLINTGYVDAINNQRLTAIDSDVKDFNYDCLPEHCSDLVDAISYLYRYVRNNASRTGVEPVRWVLAMREELFWEVTKCWPCSYYLGGCTVSDADGQRVTIDARDQIDLRDQMRNGRFLLIDGTRLDVILDDGIAESTNVNDANVNPAHYASDIYLIPMSVSGGTAVTYLEYLDYGNPSIASALGTSLLPDVRVSGAFIEWSARKNLCFWFAAKIEPRLVLRTPWLAGRITNVCYQPLQHTRQPFPDDPYFVNGGNTTRPGPSYYVHWRV